MSKFIPHFRWPVLLLWLAAALTLTLIAPTPDRTPGETTDLLPPNTPVHQALDKLATHFGDKSGLSAIVIVFERKTTPLTDQDLSDIEHIATLISKPLPSESSAESITAELQSISIRSPALLAMAGNSNPLISADRHAAFIWISLPFNYITKPAARLVRHTQQILAQYPLPPGISAAVTGSAGYGYDYAIATENSHRKTMAVTLVSVILILLFVYRAPIAAAIPLASISLAAVVVFQLLALLAPFGIHSGMAEQIFTFVLLYGAGVDYSLLVIGRYRELLETQSSADDAIRLALHATLPAIFWSAAMTISGVAMLCFARFSVFHNAGPSMVLGVAIAALAASTLTPALLAIIGPRAFWPGRATAPPRQRFWPPIARIVVTRPGWIMLLTLVVLLPPAVQGLHVQWNYDALFSLKSTYPARQGTEIVERHWPTGEIAPITLLLVAEHPTTIESWTAAASQLISEISPVPDVADIRALPQPLGSQLSAVENATLLLLDREKIRTEFLSPDLQAMRLSIVLKVPPLSRAAMDDAALIKQAAARAAAASNLPVSIDLTGATAEAIDVRTTTQQDFFRVAALALAAVLIVVTLLLRDLLISAFILAATVLSYLTAIGLAYWFFHALGATGLEWKVQMLLFIVLIAVGQDYSIFFVVRLAQEFRKFPPIQATQRALISTGPVISSCGLIMAATLGSVMAGDVRTLVQLGFAFVLGMLIDTFLVRPLLLPAFTILTRRTLHRAAIEFHHPAPSRSPDVLADAMA